MSLGQCGFWVSLRQLKSAGGNAGSVLAYQAELLDEMGMQTVLVTGANRGIGLALTKALLSRGNNVIACSRKPDAASELQSLRDGTDRLTLLSLDVDSETSVLDAVSKVSEIYGKLDVLVNNAGVFPEEGYEAFEDLDLNLFGAAFQTNVIGVARVSQGFLPLLRKGTNPRLVNISSGAGSIGAKEDNHYYCYSVSKAALNMLTKALSNELKGEGVTVVALSPGWVQTEMGGEKAPLTPEESAASIAETLDQLTIESTGNFVGRDGKAGEMYRW